MKKKRIFAILLMLTLVFNFFSYTGIDVLAEETLATPTNLRWDGSYATWDPVEGANRYFVQLYKDGAKETTTDPNGEIVPLGWLADTTCHFNANLFLSSGAGTYSFTVYAMVVDDYDNLIYRSPDSVMSEGKTVEDGYYDDPDFDFIAPFSNKPISGLSRIDWYANIPSYYPESINVLSNNEDIILSDLNTVEFQELFTADYDYETDKSSGGFAAIKGNVIKTTVKKGTGVNISLSTDLIFAEKMINLSNNYEYSYFPNSYEYYNDTEEDVTITIYLLGLHNDYQYEGYENRYYDSEASLQIRNLTDEEIELLTLPEEEKMKNKVVVVSWNEDIKGILDTLFEIHPEIKNDVYCLNLGSSGTGDEYFEQLQALINKAEDCSIIVALDGDVIKRLKEYDDRFNALKLNTLSDIGFDIDGYKDVSYGYFVDMGTFNDDLYFTTWQGSGAGAVVYRKDIAKKVFGTDDPDEVQKYLKDWDTFMDTAKTVKENGYSIVSGYEDIKYAFEERDFKDFYIDPYIDKYVKGTITFDELKENYKKDGYGDASEKILEYAQYAKNLNPYTNGNAMWSSQWNNDMNGNVLCWFGCTWFDTWSLRTNYDMGICQGPSSYVWGGTYLGVVDKGASSDKAALLLNYLCTDSEVEEKIMSDNINYVNNKNVISKMINDNTEVFSFSRYDGQNPIPVWHANLLRLSDESNNGVVENTTAKADNYGGAALSNSIKEIKDNVLTAEDKKALEAGEDVKVWLDVDDITSTVSKTDKDKIEANKPKGFEVGSYLDISLFKKIGTNAETPVTNTSGKIKIQISVPANLQKTGRDYKIARLHNGTTTILSVTKNGYDLTFETDQFSTYALLYSDPVEDKKTDDKTDTKTDTTVKTVNMYRLYNPNSGEHFYTANEKEKNNLVSVGWRYEGIGWKAPVKSNTPVYRLYNKNAGDHHYTMSEKEKDNLVKLGWKYEGIGWYSDDAKSVPLYRQYNPNAKAGSHNYTTSKSENDMLVGVGWKGEGVGWYGVK